MAVATFVEQPQTLFADGITACRTRGWVECAHGTTWPADTFASRPAVVDPAAFKLKTFANHQRRFPDCDCTLES